MELSTVQEILLIILATALAVLLVLCIVIAIVVIKLIQQARHMALRAENAVESLQAAGAMLTKSAGPLGLMRFIYELVRTVRKHK